MTLTEFLLARIAEDEAVANGAAELESGLIHAATRVNAAARGRAADMDHIARHDPARVLAECEAKRRLVEYATDTRGASDGAINTPSNSYWKGQSDAASLAARVIALPYADHPDYRTEWRP